MHCLEKLLSLAVRLLKMRRSNSSSPEELAKVLKLYLPHGIGLDYLKPNPEEVAACYESLVVEMLTLSARPTQCWISAACLLAYQKIDKAEAKTFGQRLCQCCQHCFNKKLQATTGKKLSQPMKRILSVISKGQRPQSQGDLLRRHAARQLKRRKSNESEKGTPVKGTSQMYSDMIAPASSNPAQSSASTAHGLYEAMLGNSHAFPNTIASGSQEVELIVSSQEEPEQKIPNNALLPTCDGSATSTKASWFDPSHNAMARSSSTSPGQVVVASMEPGKDGFCVATFPGEKPFVTEVANVLLKKSSAAEQTEKGTATKKRPATKSLKRPAAALQEPAPDHAATATHEPQAEDALPVSCLNYFFPV